MRSSKSVVMWLGAVAVVTLTVAMGPMVVQRFAYAAEKGANDAARDELVKLSGQEQVSKLFRMVAKVVKPAVVEVRVKKRIKMPNFGGGGGMSEDFFRRFLGEDGPGGPMQPRPDRRRRPQPDRFYMQSGLGSGVIVDAKNGYILTNHHVVGTADEVEIVLHDGAKYDAEWVRGDWKTDVAVVKVKAKGLIAAPLGDSDKMEVGDWVLAIGSPEGLDQTVTAGIISAKGRRTGGRPYENYLQTDAAINHGNSGGPLVNMTGGVIGINTAIVSRTGVNEGLGLSIPSNMAKRIMRQLIDKGTVTRGYLGVMIQDVDAELAKTFELPHAKGALVTKVLAGSPAAEGKLKGEDFITAIDGKPIDGKDALRHRVADLPPGEKVAFTLYRTGKKRTVTVTLGAQPDSMDLAVKAPDEEKVRPGSYGLEVTTLTKALAQRQRFPAGTTGVLVTDVEAGSEAAEKGLAPGQVIDQVDGRAVADSDGFAKALTKADKGGKLRLRVLSRAGGRRYVLISPK